MQLPLFEGAGPTKESSREIVSRYKSPLDILNGMFISSAPATGRKSKEGVSIFSRLRSNLSLYQPGDAPVLDEEDARLDASFTKLESLQSKGVKFKAVGKSSDTLEGEFCGKNEDAASTLQQSIERVKASLA